MMISIFLTFVASFTFAIYNALSIKGMTETNLWHIIQLVVIALFMTCDFPKMVLETFNFLKSGDFHNFGRSVTKLLLTLAASVGLYVYTLHYTLEKFWP